MDTREDKGKREEGQGVPLPAVGGAARLGTLSSIEDALFGREVRSLAEEVNRCTKALNEAISKAGGHWEHQAKANIRKSVMKCLEGDHTYWESTLKEDLTESAKKEILKRVAGDFLKRVDEIEQIAEQARAEGR
jgi:hypothetical protein